MHLRSLESWVSRYLHCAAFVALFWSSASFSQNASLARIMSALPSVQAQLVFEGAQLANQQMSSFRLITKLSPERLISEFESVWLKNEGAKVWRSETETWLMISKVERFPEVEVLQAKRGPSGETVARLSIGSTRFTNLSSGTSGSDASVAALLSQWLPTNSKVLQSFASTDPGRRGYLLIARSDATLKESLDWVEAQAKRIGFRSDPHLKTNLGSGQSAVAVLYRGSEEVILTLDREGSNVAIVLQHSRSER